MPFIAGLGHDKWILISAPEVVNKVAAEGFDALTLEAIKAGQDISSVVSVTETSMGPTASDKFTDPAAADTLETEYIGTAKAEGKLTLFRNWDTTDGTPEKAAANKIGDSAHKTLVDAREALSNVIVVHRRTSKMSTEDVTATDLLHAYIGTPDHGVDVGDYKTFQKESFDIAIRNFVRHKAFGTAPLTEG